MICAGVSADAGWVLRACCRGAEVGVWGRCEVGCGGVKGECGWWVPGCEAVQGCPARLERERAPSPRGS